jgi:hypothetical protein
MLGFLTRRGRARPRPVRPVRPALLGLEQLEARDAPATLTMSVSYGTGRNITLFGHLGDVPDNTNQLVVVSGQATGTTRTNANGDYSLSVTAAGLGVVTGTSNGASASVTLTSPTLSIDTFASSEGGGGLFTFTGSVSQPGRSVAGLQITFGGIPSMQGQTATVQADGTFSVVVQLSGKPADTGFASADVTDAWGTAAPTEYDYVYQTP